ncbi:MAG: SAM-dependent methyltransferase, partial [Burkholderiales bacterium]
MPLPPPSHDALEHSAKLCELIRAEIAASGGAISFARYMELALYAPGLGYYQAGARKLGRDGDFITAPELSPLFGRTLARQAQQILRQGFDQILEIGAGSGALAASLLEELQRLDALPRHYHILEISPDLRSRSRDLLAARVPHLMERVAWLNQLPPSFSGLVIGNEVLDAMPVHVITRRQDDILENSVGYHEKQKLFCWSET